MPPSPATYAVQIHQAVTQQDGQTLASLLSLTPPERGQGRDEQHQRYLLDWLGATERAQRWIDRTTESKLPAYKKTFEDKLDRGLLRGGPWADMATCHLWCLVALTPPLHLETGAEYTPKDFLLAYSKQHQLVTAIHRYLQDAHDGPTGWALPVLYQVCRDLRTTAEKADTFLLETGQKATKLEEASRLLQKCFSICVNDRWPDIKAGRKFGTYYLATLLFKVYFRLNSTALCRNLQRGIAVAELPPLHAYPRAHQVTWQYYMGVFAFLEERHDEAEKLFTKALCACHKKAKPHITLILDYLIPLHLLRGVLPSAFLYLHHPRHRALYEPFANAIKQGDVAAYDRQLERGEKALMARGTYLVVERAREAAVRGGLKKAWIVGSIDPVSRVSSQKPKICDISLFRTAYNLNQRSFASSGSVEGAVVHGGAAAAAAAAEVEVDEEEMECLLVNMIAKGLIKGYISHEKQKVVLSKEKPFPWYQPKRPLSEQEAAVRAEKERVNKEKVVELCPLPSSA